MSSQAIKDYLQDIEQALKAGNSTEHTHRPALKMLLEALGGNDVRATNEPKQVACGAPDFILTRGVVPLGNVEAKDVGADLSKVEHSDQLRRYRQSLANLVLTDYLEFRWYLDGELRLTASLPRPDRNGRIRWDADAASGVAQLLRQFISADIPLKSNPKDLATRMAGLAQLIRDLIRKTFVAEDKGGELHGQFKAFRRVLIESLTEEQFADMYAQTLAYGLFAARCNSPAEGFSRQKAASALPKTNPFLRKLFHTIAGPDLDERIAWAVDQLAELLSRADMSAILADFGRRTRQEDPVVHFYETFLAAYDPKMREARGVYYTPEPVVGYIVRSVDSILRRDFGMKEGLAHAKRITLKRPKVPGQGKGKGTGKGLESYETHRLQILDPATGTGTFLYTVIHKIREHFDGNAGAWPGYVADHLLPRLYGFELLMAPYTVAHMKLGLELGETGYDFASDQRLGVYLTNTLEEPSEMTGLPLFTQWLAEESRAAASIKRDAPVMVVLGNPPYSGQSANTGDWITGLMRGHDSINNCNTESYFEVDGKPLGERNPKWLNDDYVKFMRFAQWRIQRTGYGVLAYVTNHGYLDNPTFRGMRESLMRGFDDIYLLDLHGNTKKQETTPEGGTDENVFDIQQGVAIGIFVRRENRERDDGHRARVFHADLFGLRKEKYAVLDATDVEATEWTELTPGSPNYYFVPANNELAAEYLKGWKITEAMPVNSVGIVTARDSLTIRFDAEDVWHVVNELTSVPEADARAKFNLQKDSSEWKLTDAKQDLQDSGPKRNLVLPISYRPFDTRFTYFTGRSRGFHGRPRMQVMQHLLPSSESFIVSRQSNAATWTNVGAATGLVDHCAVSNRTSEIGSVFPLWLLPDQLLDTEIESTRANLAPEFLSALGSLIDTATPDSALTWIYAILHSPSYRARYAEYLKRDFPHIPLTTSRELFEALSTFGEELLNLHTMKKSLPRITTFEVTGDNSVDKVRWAPGKDGTGRVYINADQYFGKVPDAVWETHIGSYRVADKWLKDRRGRSLTYDDLEHYQSVIAALARTLEIQADIDDAIEEAGGWPLQ